MPAIIAKRQITDERFKPRGDDGINIAQPEDRAKN